MTLRDVLESERAVVLERWGQVIQQWASVAGIHRDQLLDGFPAMLDELIESLAPSAGPEGNGGFPQESDLAARHAEARLTLGFDVGFLVRDYAALRDCILRRLEEIGHQPDTGELRKLNAALDARAWISIEHFSRLHERRDQRVISEARSEKDAEESLGSIRRAEAALRESEERFRLLVESVQDHGMFIVSIDGRVSGWNPGAQRLKGYRAEEIIGKHLRVFFTERDIIEHVPERLLRRAAAEDHSEYEGWLVRKDGSRFWSAVSFSAVRDEHGRLRGFSNVAKDNTARKLAEETHQFLSRAGEELASTLDYNATLRALARLATVRLADWCAVFVVTPGRRQVLVAHAERDKQELLQRAVAVAPVECARGVGAVLRTGESELCADTMEGPWVREALGVTSPELLMELGARSYMCVPLKVRGETIAVMALVSTSPSREYTDADLAAAEELARRGALAVENARLFREAQEAVRARDEFISMASHDLRTPLTTTRLHLQRLRRRHHELQPEEMSAELKRVDGQLERLVQMMDALMDVTTISAGRLQLKPRKMDLSEVAREVGARLADDLARSGSELQIHADQPVTGTWDRFRVEQVIMNLLSNAVKYGGGKPLELTVTGDETWGHVGIRDHGGGIAPEEQERLFERFERGRVDRSIAGFGVGLWIVKRIVDAHGGRVRVESTEDDGTTFWVDLPRVEARSDERVEQDAFPPQSEPEHLSS